MNYRKLFPILFLILSLIISSLIFVYAKESNNKIEKENFSGMKEYEIFNVDLLQKNTNVVIGYDDYNDAKNLIEKNKEEFKDFLGNNNLLIVINDDNEATMSLTNELDFPFEVSDVEKVDSDEGKTISTIYGMDSNGKPFIHDIMVDNSIEESDYQDIINEEIKKVRNQRDVEEDESNPTAFINSNLLASTNKIAIDNSTTNLIGSTSYETDYIGYYSTGYDTTKGNLHVKYKFYTLQDYGDEEYYFVVAYVDGNSGYTLYNAGDEYYNEDYQGEQVDVTIKSNTSGLTREEYSPHRTVDSTTYTSEIGAWHAATGVSVSGNFSRAYDISDTDISVCSTSSTTKWLVSYSDDAQLETNSFYPSISFCCDDGESSGSIYTDATYYVDSVLSTAYEIDIDKYITCYL